MLFAAKWSTFRLQGFPFWLLFGCCSKFTSKALQKLHNYLKKFFKIWPSKLYSSIYEKQKEFEIWIFKVNLCWVYGLSEHKNLPLYTHESLKINLPVGKKNNYNFVLRNSRWMPKCMPANVWIGLHNFQLLCHFIFFFISSSYNYFIIRRFPYPITI